ncbi:hypothetical protein BDK51DRAFT_52697 [Blyttiomyces helicus]|uniref:Uncharacterized protein n=1 Tax=Blyttiomyces helicus TaxID=388810 RepID=A0A4V1IQJ2_9FUNG|nr:hypothetical protein BDK51DRAFT_52697 [Blyttiomyces helicus]|eukprot:RKO86747.1 hypothetical protein BDK51DRAFT_52697 [Blyttiomyces helicus]
MKSDGNLPQDYSGEDVKEAQDAKDNFSLKEDSLEQTLDQSKGTSSEELGCASPELRRSAHTDLSSETTKLRRITQTIVRRAQETL